MAKTAPASHSGVAPTQTVAVAMAAMDQLTTRTLGMPGLGVLWGKPGLGKTSAITRLAHPTDVNAVYLRCRSIDTTKSLSLTLLRELGVENRSSWTISEMFDAAIEALLAQNRPLVIDEVDHIAKSRMIELLRDLHDIGQVPILMVGEGGLQRTLERYHKRFHDRVLVWCEAVPCDVADLDKLQALYAPKLALEADAKKALLAKTDGNSRRIITALHNLQERTRTMGLERISAADLGAL